MVQLSLCGFTQDREAESWAWSWRDAGEEGSQQEAWARGSIASHCSAPEIDEQGGLWSPWSSRVGAQLEQTEG